MSDTSAFGFGKFIPGFEFLQNLGKTGSTSTGLPPFSHWMAPTVREEEIEKRIEELKAVQFWLDQNSKALAATVQALEVQRMTLSTLKGMNVNLADLASGFGFTPGHPEQPQADGDLSQWPMSAAGKAAAAQAAAAPQPAPEPAAAAAPPVQEPPQSAAPDSTSQSAHNASMTAATQWWGALTQQFQQIAQQALQDPAQQQAVVQATQMTTEFAKTAVKAATDMVKKAVVQATPTAPASKPTVAKKSAPKATASRAAPVKKSASADKKATSARAKAKPHTAKQSTPVARKKPAS